MANNIESRKKILEAARDEFSEKGFDGARVSNISKKAGVNQALIYYYFPSKTALLDEILDNFLEECKTHLKSTYLENGEQSDPREFTKEEFSKTIDFIFSRRREYQLLMSQILKDCDEQNKYMKFLRDLNRELRSYLLSFRGYDFDESDDAQKIVDYFFVFIPTTMFGALGTRWLESNDVSREDFDETVVDIMTTLSEKYYKKEGKKKKGK